VNISDNEIHLWFAYDQDISDDGLLSKYHQLLNQEESTQQARFHFEKHRHQYLITRAMVRTVLSSYVNSISPEEWRFKKNKYGKPSISNKSLTMPLRFNLSHTDKLIIMAVTLDNEIGVDVEYLPRRGNPLDIAERFFSAKELEQLFQLPVEKRQERFFDLWTLKEAYIKACGMGLSIPLDHFSYSFSESGGISIDFVPERCDQPELWQFWQVNPNETHKISMALKRTSAELNNELSISMREFVPLSEIKTVYYPITKGRLVTNE